MSRPMVWGILAGGLVGVILMRRRGPGKVSTYPYIPKPTKQKGRLKLPGQERGIGN